MSQDTDPAETDAARDKVMLLYDHAKHLLSLALLGMGGILSLAQSPQGQKVPAHVVSLTLIFLAISGVCALSCSAAILRARQHDRPVGHGAWLCNQGAMLFLGMGVGGFLTLWIEALS